VEQEKVYASKEDMLNDMELAYDAGPGKTHLALSIMKGHSPGYKKAGLLRERFHLSFSLGWGGQGREGGSQKGKEKVDPEDPKFDVNGPLHFFFEDHATKEPLEKCTPNGLASYREEPGRDGRREKLARKLKVQSLAPLASLARPAHLSRPSRLLSSLLSRLFSCASHISSIPLTSHTSQASKADETLPLREACVRANAYNSLWVSLLDGTEQSRLVPDVFVMDPEHKVLYAR
jgi:hypothetical protein